MSFDPKNSLPLGVIICTYNVKEKVLENIQSVLDQETQVPYEVLVVDSGSTDGTIEAVQEKFPQVKTLRSEENLGSAKGRNLGIEFFENRDVLLLDSDVVLEKDVIEQMSHYVNENTGQVCGHLYSVDGSPQCTAFRRPHLLSLCARLFYFENYLPPVLREKYTNEDLKKELSPFWTSGGFTWVTRRALKTAGLKDKDFFVYGEELEHGHRIHEAGYEMIYTPKARALHYGSSSTRQNISKCREDVYRGLVLYWKKCQPWLYPFALALIILKLLLVALSSPFLPRQDRWEISRSHWKVIGALLF